MNDGDIFRTGFNPAAVISLTTPKLCMQGYTGKHYIGGRYEIIGFRWNTIQYIVLVLDATGLCHRN